MTGMGSIVLGVWTVTLGKSLVGVLVCAAG